MNNPLTPTPTRPSRDDWREQAACREYNVQRGDDPWFSDQPHERAMAAAICHRCPVRALCAEAAAEESIGVWAGKPRGWISRRVASKPRVGACPRCWRATRPSGIPLSDAPGTLIEGRHGMCRSCSDAIRGAS